MAEQTNEARPMMTETYGDNKLNKSTELNETMTINENSRDSYTETLHNLGGKD